jgi:hypothetical protein
MPGLFIGPTLSWVFLYARAKQSTAAWERRHPVVSKVALILAVWCAASGVVMVLVAALFGWVAVSRSVSAGWTWAIGLAAVFSFGVFRERMLRLGKRGLSARRTTGRLWVAALVLWPCVAAMINGRAAAVGIVAIEATFLIGVRVAQVSGRPDPLPPAF